MFMIIKVSGGTPLMEEYRIFDVNITETSQLLENSGWFNLFNSSQLETIAKYFFTYKLPQGVEIIKENELNDIIGLITEGKVAVNKRDSRDAVKTLATFGKDKVIGEVSFFDQWPSSANVVALEDVTLLVISRIRFQTLRSQHPYLAIELLEQVI